MISSTVNSVPTCCSMKVASPVACVAINLFQRIRVLLLVRCQQSCYQGSCSWAAMITPPEWNCSARSASITSLM